MRKLLPGLMKRRLVRLLALLPAVLPGRLLSLFPSSLLGVVGRAGRQALAWAGVGAARLGVESSVHPDDAPAAHQAGLAVLLIPRVAAAQVAAVAALLQAAGGRARQGAPAAPGISQVAAGSAQGLLRGCCVMAGPPGGLGLYRWPQACALALSVPRARVPFCALEESWGQLKWFIQKEGRGGL